MRSPWRCWSSRPTKLAGREASDLKSRAPLQPRSGEAVEQVADHAAGARTSACRPESCIRVVLAGIPRDTGLRGGGAPSPGLRRAPRETVPPVGKVLRKQEQRPTRTLPAGTGNGSGGGRPTAQEHSNPGATADVRRQPRRRAILRATARPACSTVARVDRGHARCRADPSRGCSSVIPRAVVRRRAARLRGRRSAARASPSYGPGTWAPPWRDARSSAWASRTRAVSGPDQEAAARIRGASSGACASRGQHITLAVNPQPPKPSAGAEALLQRTRGASGTWGRE